VTSEGLSYLKLLALPHGIEAVNVNQRQQSASKQIKTVVLEADDRSGNGIALPHGMEWKP
jgi:mannitol/fructose-specific phosphotransferase system IIA component